MAIHLPGSGVTAAAGLCGGDRSYKHVWQLFSQKGKALSCQNRLPLGAEKRANFNYFTGSPGL